MDTDSSNALHIALSWYSVAAAKDDDCLKIYKSLKNGESFVIEPFEQLLDSITWTN